MRSARRAPHLRANSEGTYLEAIDGRHYGRFLDFVKLIDRGCRILGFRALQWLGCCFELASQWGVTDDQRGLHCNAIWEVPSLHLKALIDEQLTLNESVQVTNSGSPSSDPGSVALSRLAELSLLKRGIILLWDCYFLIQWSKQERSDDVWCAALLLCWFKWIAEPCQQHWGVQQDAGRTEPGQAVSIAWCSNLSES